MLLMIVPVRLLQIPEDLKCKHVLADDREARQKQNDMRNAKCASESFVCHFDTKQQSRKTASVVRGAMVLLAFSRWSPTMQRSMTSTCMRIHIFLGTASAFSASTLFSSQSSSPFKLSSNNYNAAKTSCMKDRVLRTTGKEDLATFSLWALTVNVVPC